MEENRSNLDKTMDNLLIRAEKAGKIKFENQDEKETLKKELIDLYRQKAKLEQKIFDASQDAQGYYSQFASRDEKKAAKKRAREAKRELKVLKKSLEGANNTFDKKMQMFDLPSIGGVRTASQMMWNAYKEDQEENDRKMRREMLCPRVNVNPRNAVKAVKAKQPKQPEHQPEQPEQRED